MDDGGTSISGAERRTEVRSYRAAVERLSAAQKPGAGVPAYLRWINRGLGRRAAALAWTLRLTPNLVTAASGILSIAAFIVIASAPPSWAIAFLATTLLLAGYALDSADGQLARLMGGGNAAGEWLDHVVDAARLPLFHLAICLHFVRIEKYQWLVVIGLAYLVLSSVWFFAQILAEKLGSADQISAEAPVWMSFAKLPYDVGTLYLTVVFLTLPLLFSILYIALFVTTAVIAGLSFGRKYRTLNTSVLGAGQR